MVRVVVTGSELVFPPERGGSGAGGRVLVVAEREVVGGSEERGLLGWGRFPHREGGVCGGI